MMTTADAQHPGAAVRPSRFATEPGLVLLVVVVVSLLVHGLLVFATYDRPIGVIDPALLAQEQSMVRVRRASRDQFVELAPREGVAEADPEPTLADLSEALLDVTDPPGLDDAYEPDLEMRALDESLPPSAASELAVELPAFELPDDVLAQLTTQTPGELEYRGSAEAGFGAAVGEGGVGGGGGSQAARELLSRSGLIGGGGGASVLDRPVVVDRPELDDQSIEMPMSGPEIDFAGLALSETTQLDVPEHLDQDFDYAVTQYRDPRDRGEPGWFRVDITPRRSLQKLQTMPKDVVYLVDTSSSVPQSWIREVVAGVQQSLRLLNEGDRFNVVMFSDNPAFFSTRGAVPATVQNVEAGIRFLEDARSQGYTDVNAALSHVLVRDVEVARVYELVLITDGLPTRGVMDTRELINLITRDNNLATSIYCVGIGRRTNKELLDFLAYRNKGFSVFTNRRDRIAPTIRDLASRLRYPLIKDLAVSVAGPHVSEVYPLDLPNIHQGERFSVFGRFDQASPFTMQIAGTSSGRHVDFTFTRDLADAPPGDEAVARDWAFWKLHHLYSEMIRQGDQPHLLDQIRHIRDRYNLKTLY